MRLAVTLIKDSKGKWDMLSDPSIPIIEQKQLFKKLKVNGGDLNGKQIDFVAVFVKPVKRAKFTKSGLVNMPKSVPGIPREKPVVGKAKDSDKTRAKAAAKAVKSDS